MTNENATERQAKNLLSGRFESPAEHNARLAAEVAAAEEIVRDKIEADRQTKGAASAATRVQAARLKAAYDYKREG
jgi:hypothetical protein